MKSLQMRKESFLKQLFSAIQSVDLCIHLSSGAIKSQTDYICHIIFFFFKHFVMGINIAEVSEKQK